MPPNRRLKPDDHAHRMSLNQYLTRKGPGEEDHAPTPERVIKAKAAGENVRANVIYTERGLPTGNFYWSITPVIDELKRRSTITEDEYEAAFRFIRHWHNGSSRGPSTSQFTPRYDGDVSDLEPEERRWHYAQMANNAYNSVGPILQPALQWLVRSMGDALPLQALGAFYAPNKGSQTQVSQGGMVLRLACISLCDYYRISHPILQQRIEKASQELLSKIR